MSRHRYSVSIMPRDGILDPQGRAVEAALPQLHAESVRDVRVGRRVELTVEAPAEPEARTVVERLASDFLANPLVESWHVEELQTAGLPPAEAAR